MSTNPHEQMCYELERVEGLYTVIKEHGSNQTTEKTCSHQLWLSTKQTNKNNVAVTLNFHIVRKQVFIEFFTELKQQLVLYIDYGTVKCPRNVRTSPIVRLSSRLTLFRSQISMQRSVP